MLNRRYWLLQGLPEVLALAKVAVFGQSLPEALLTAQLFWMAWIGAEVIHGLGHTLAQVVVDQDPSAFTLGNLLEHRSPSHMAQGLLTWVPIRYASREAPRFPGWRREIRSHGNCG